MKIDDIIPITKRSVNLLIMDLLPMFPWPKVKVLLILTWLAVCKNCHLHHIKLVDFELPVVTVLRGTVNLGWT